MSEAANPDLRPTVAYDFTGRQVLVTGGSNGIGLEIARAFADAGATVTITGRKASADEYDHDLSAFRYAQCDMSDNDQIDALAAGLDALDVLVNNAGQNLARENEWEPENFDRILQINLSSVFRLTNAVLPLLKASDLPGGGNVINTGSMTSYFAISVTPAYGATKAAIVQLTKTMAVTWGADGVRANAVAPGLVETNMTRPMITRGMSEPTVDRTPLGRVGAPDDLSGVVLFLASSAAKFVTGQTLLVDGGFSVQG
ncbi:SDR family NAD(P)-dependent oxidoreductase [Enemella sp. A6]|uniref:SDR family NAD(P)-dependent oxidoreductase n=1 Tax=Enemella sp. A6 TaxID=3440152 RepID=UPI003EBB622C